MRLSAVCCLASLVALPAAGCEVALLLAVDVSGSVDRREFAVQMQGLAEGLRDPVVSGALARGQSAVALMQWTGASRQVLSVGWTRITRLPRVWTEFSTAIGQAMTYGSGVFDRAPACRRRVMDVSSDGRNNEGTEPAEVKPVMDSLAIIVNALVIRGDDAGLPAYFAENVMTGPNAFVVTAEDYDDYAERMRRKLRRETERAVSALPVEAIPARYAPRP